MDKRFTLIAFLAIILSTTLSFAPYSQVFYSSNTKVEYNTGTRSLEFSTKLLTVNIEKTLSVRVDNPSFEGKINDYLTKNLKVTVNGASKKIKFAGKQKTLKTTRIYYEISGVDPKIKSLEITNTLLMKEFPSQHNFVNVDINGRRSSFICKKGDTKGKVIF